MEQRTVKLKKSPQEAYDEVIKTHPEITKKIKETEEVLEKFGLTSKINTFLESDQVKSRIKTAYDKFFEIVTGLMKDATSKLKKAGQEVLDFYTEENFAKEVCNNFKISLSGKIEFLQILVENESLISEIIVNMNDDEYLIELELEVSKVVAEMKKLVLEEAEQADETEETEGDEENKLPKDVKQVEIIVVFL